ncbi:aspartate transaminase [Trichophyton equinum CBS 127.97]|uniref:Aspartate aminotransferase n=1 Tax=Trichophyton equinum (strain ATCC MYA-4606 / CBS 127.97) TaxID=559882 RepID=F2Q5N1_TRIEC|nr:aspartate transaminase [Trichophyton equinum CBS 127.97]
MSPAAVSTIARDRLDTVSRHIMTPSFFTPSAVPKAPEDPLFGLAAACKADTSDKKIDLGIGAYRDSDAKPWVLPVVKKGFASGDLARDSWAVRYFISEGFEMCISQSFAKNFGLYGERAGAFHFITAPGPNAAEALSNVASQLAILQRSEISNPPAYGARIASLILNDATLFKEWEEDLRTMSGRIVEMRKGVRERLEEKGTPGTWDHITNQIGMFSFTGLTEEQVQILREKWHIYMTKNGRISMAGLNVHNIDYFAEAVDAVVRETTK